MPLGLFDGRPDAGDLMVAVGLALAIAYVVAYVAARLARAAFARLLGAGADILVTPAVRRPLRVLRAAVFLIVAIALLVPFLRLAGVRSLRGVQPAAVGTWFLQSGLRIALIAVAAYILTRIASVVVQRFELEVSRAGGDDVLDRAKRARTLGSLVQNVVTASVIGIAALMILRELRVDIMPVLTGAGIVGLAIGFGAQTLVKDIIAGFFLILEDQVRVGDSAVINQVPGVVEAINLRTIVLRDIEGSVHIFPNGAVTTLSNRSRDYAYAVLDVKVPFKHDVDEVVDALRDVGETLCVDPQFRPHILEPLEVLGIEAFDDATVTLKMRIKTVPLKQMDVARELRRRLKRMFDARGLAMPYPQVSVLFGQKK